MDNAEVSAKAEEAAKFLKCEVRAAHYYQKMAGTLFNRLAAARGLGDLVLDRVEPETPEDLYEFVVRNCQTRAIMARGNLREAKVRLVFGAATYLRKENDFIKGYFELCGLRVG